MKSASHSISGGNNQKTNNFSQIKINLQKYNNVCDVLLMLLWLMTMNRK
jgi:hypothetical protein